MPDQYKGQEGRRYTKQEAANKLAAELEFLEGD